MRINARRTSYSSTSTASSIHSVYLFNKHGTRIYYDAWLYLQKRMVEWVCDNWCKTRPMKVSVEARGGRQHFTYSRLMSWVAVDRVIPTATSRSSPLHLTRWQSTRDQIFQQIMAKGWSRTRRRSFRQDGTDVLDAGILLMPLVDFVEATHPRRLSTLDVIFSQLQRTVSSTATTWRPRPDGLDSGRGDILDLHILANVEALARAGRLRRGTAGLREDVDAYQATISVSTPSRSDSPVRRSATSHKLSPTWCLISAGSLLDRKLGRA